MPAPTVYTEALFADYLVTVVGSDIIGILGWDVGSPQVQEALADALLEYGETTITNIVGTNGFVGTKPLRRLRALGRRAIWRAVVQATAGKYDFSDSDAKFSRSQINEQASAYLKLAESDCLEWSPTYVATAVKVARPQDPYVVLPDSERTT